MRLGSSDFVRKVASTYATQFLLVGINAATLIVVTRVLGPKGRGDYAYAIWLSAMGVQLANLGLAAGSTYQVSKNHERLPALFGNCLIISLLVGGLGAAAATILFDYWPGPVAIHGGLLTLALLSIPLSLALLLLQNLLVAIHAVGTSNALDLCNNLVKAGLIALLVCSGLGSPSLIFAANLLGAIIALLWAVWALSHRCAGRPQFSGTVFRDTIGYGSKMYAAALLTFLATRMDVALVRGFLGAKALGLYAVAQLLAQQALLFPQVVGQMIFPRLCRAADWDNRWRMIKKALFIIALIMTPAVVLAWVFARPFILLCFGPDYADSVEPFRWLLPGVLFWSLGSVAQLLLHADGFRTSLLLAWLAALPVNLALNVWLLPLWGIRGAGLASSAALALLSATVLTCCVKEVRARRGQPRQLA